MHTKNDSLKKLEIRKQHRSKATIRGGMDVGYDQIGIGFCV